MFLSPRNFLLTPASKDIFLKSVKNLPEWCSLGAHFGGHGRVEVRSPVARLRLVAHHLCHSLTQIPNCVRLKARSGRPCTCGVVGRPCPKSGTSPHAVFDPAWLPSWCVSGALLSHSPCHPNPLSALQRTPPSACVRSRHTPPDATSLGADPDLVQIFRPPPPPR
jgi:hypothetical protein